MQRKVLAAIVASVVAVVAIAAIAFGPANLANLANPGTNPNLPDTGTGPRPTSVDAPTWHVGDTWTYQANMSGAGKDPDGPSASGNLTRTVVSADADHYNVSLEGSFHVSRVIDPAPDTDMANASMMTMCVPFLRNATVTGYTWYRTSDLALLKEVRAVELGGSIQTEGGTYNASYSATVETTFDPALDVWSFPLEANETWNATSNATVHVSVQWHFDGPHIFWDFGKNFTFKVPVRLFLMSGETEDVTTPAGTFASIPVRIGVPAIVRAQADPADSAMGLDHEVPVARDHSVQMWFSGAAKNVVKTELFAGLIRVNLVLASYHVS